MINRTLIDGSVCVALLCFIGSVACAQEPAPPATETASPAVAPAELAKPSKPANAKAAKPSESAKAEQPRKTGPDRLDLDKTVVTGNRELPKVLYIVPWKKSDIGDLPAQPFNTLLDEALAPVDRDVFKRELRYYDALQGAGQKTAPPASQGEK